MVTRPSCHPPQRGENSGQQFAVSSSFQFATVRTRTNCTWNPPSFWCSTHHSTLLRNLSLSFYLEGSTSSLSKGYLSVGINTRWFLCDKWICTIQRPKSFPCRCKPGTTSLFSFVKIHTDFVPFQLLHLSMSSWICLSWQGAACDLIFWTTTRIILLTGDTPSCEQLTSKRPVLNRIFDQLLTFAGYQVSWWHQSFTWDLDWVLLLTA